MTNSRINHGNTRNIGDTFTIRSQGGSETIGDFSNSFSADQNYNIQCDVPDTNPKTPNTNSSRSRQVKQKVINIVQGKKTKSYTANKKSN